MPTVFIVQVAGTADGGVLAAGTSSPGSPGYAAGILATKLRSDGTPVWTFASGSQTAQPSSIAARGSSFAIVGDSSGPADYDPGPTGDVVAGDRFLSRFSF